MHPKAKIVPRKIGIQGPSIKKKVSSSSSPSFTRDEMVELRRLSTMLPPAARGRDAADLVMHAASYIQQLVATVHARVNNGTLPLEALHSLPPSPQPPQVSSRPPQSRVRPSTTKRKRRSVEKRH